MAFKHSCFISYRHTKEYKGRRFTERIVEDLKAELDFRVAQGVFRDIERLKGAEFYNEALATALCQSVCMVVLYWPTYFDGEHLFCAREFKAMEELEEKRLGLLPPGERANSLIIIVALRGFDQIPAEIRAKRLCKDFERYTLKPNMRQDPSFQLTMLEIGSYIADRCRAVLSASGISFTSCDSFRLPTEDQVRPWVARFASGALPFANRETER
ncbi:MAG TPA: hypothetical protein VN999_09400 [Thermoanaerobaculia bacterium]|nr:hypothetical protein [Thermoanaerobaculia bacterium]